jgi:2-desacetyl-2-hydroxyethyl bacteriochlorophyllide A dehydrogenase
MIARLAVLAGGHPVVWETNPARRTGAVGYEVIDPSTDSRKNYKCICDVSGASTLLDELIGRLAPGGEVVLAGFYDTPLSFVFPPAFMREARIRVAAQWAPHRFSRGHCLSWRWSFIPRWFDHASPRCKPSRSRISHRVWRCRLFKDGS